MSVYFHQQHKQLLTQSSLISYYVYIFATVINYA